ncbi:Ras GTPase-activating protein 4 [Leucoagaricus sp. SymC.cos]|nr:Ras GTPase-activating protein 4 [Leucoagaricus sp. SymC.cos]
MSNKFKRALKNATSLPFKAARGSSRGFSPAQGELPVVVLRVQVVGCGKLLSKDKNGFSDPFVAVTVLNARQQTPVAKRTLDPTYNAKDATFDFPLYLSTADKLGALELIVWDKDVLSKDYLGEAALPLENWFVERPFAFSDPQNTVPVHCTACLDALKHPYIRPLPSPSFVPDLSLEEDMSVISSLFCFFFVRLHIGSDMHAHIMILS